MSRQVLLARLDYIFAACCFALLAAAVTKLRSDLSSWLTLLAIVLPTGFVAGIASSRLVRRNHVAALRSWIVAGVLVPIAAVVGFMEATFLVERQTGSEEQRLYLSAVAVGALIAVPVGLAGHLLLRRWIKSRYGFPDVPTRRRTA